jgi:putative ABC transport system substrate-binding protein
MPDAMFFFHRERIAELAVQHRLPSISILHEYPHLGGLMSYIVDIPDSYRRAAPYVDKILRGAKPADLPVEQPTKFNLTINQKTARAIGLAIPQALLLRAEKVIE